MAEELHLQTTTNTSNLLFWAGGGYTNAYMAQRFTPTADINLSSTEIYVSNIYGAGINRDCVCYIYADDGTTVTGPALGTSDTVAGVTVGTSFHKFTFSTTVPLTNGTSYWAVFATTYDAANYVMICGTSSGVGLRRGNDISLPEYFAFTMNVKIYSEIVVKKVLLQDGTTYYNIQAGVLTEVGSGTRTEALFTTYGMDNLSTVTKAHLEALTNPQVILYDT